MKEADQMNEKGEFPGKGPEWACDRHGRKNHDYLTCRDCKDRFKTYMAAKADLAQRRAA